MARPRPRAARRLGARGENTGRSGVAAMVRSKTRPPQPSPRDDEPFYSVAHSPSGSVNPHKVTRAVTRNRGASSKCRDAATF
eukprot:6937229-Prymnesium_polylepis.1